MTVKTINSTPLVAPWFMSQLVERLSHLGAMRWVRDILTLRLGNWISWVTLTIRNDNRGLLPAGTSRRSTLLPSHPPPTSYPAANPGTLPHSHHHVSLPQTQSSAAFWMQIKPQWGEKKKRLKRDMFWSIIKQVFDAKAQKKTLFLSRSNIYVFGGRRHRQLPRADRRTTAGWRTRRQETEMSLDFSVQSSAQHKTDVIIHYHRTSGRWIYAETTFRKQTGPSARSHQPPATQKTSLVTSSCTLTHSNGLIWDHL